MLGVAILIIVMSVMNGFKIDLTKKILGLNPHIVIQPNVEIKVRGNGVIILENGVQLDTNVRIVAAEDRVIHIKEGGQIGFGTILNGGADITIGKGSAIASNCLLQASEHKLPILKNLE